MVSISPITAADVSEWLPLWEGYLSFYKTKLSVGTTQRTFERLLAQGTSIHGVFARDNQGVAVGFVHWVEHVSTWSANEVTYLEDLFVHPDCRKSGVGRALIEHVVAFAKERGHSQVYWLTAEDNTTARSLYDLMAKHTGMVQYAIDLEMK